MDEENAPVIIDNGSESTKIGFAGDDAPKVIFPTVIGYPKTIETDKKDNIKNIYLGEEIYQKRDTLTMKYPIECGIVNNWDELEIIWNHIFQKELNISSSDRPVLITEPPMNQKANREKILQIMFEKFNVPSMYLAIQTVLALYSSGRTTGIAIECGDNMSHIVPVYDGYALPHAIMRSNFAGRDLTNYLINLLEEKGLTLNTLGNREVVTNIKEKLCYVALDYEHELESSSQFLGKSYELPDGNTITIGDERFRCPEALFQPFLLESGSNGIHDMTFNSIMKCDMDIRKDMYANMVLAGGTSMIPGFGERLEKEIKLRAPATIKKKVYAPINRKYAAWVGGSILASSPSFLEMWISKKEYEEFGASIIDKKCF